MRDASPQTIYLKDYTPPSYLVDRVQLTFKLHPTETKVISRVEFYPNPDTDDRRFFLHGEELKLAWAKIDGSPVTPDITEAGLACAAPDAAFVWECEVEISPSTNTALEGLYMSNGMYCTQCEAEGFRKITYYPDRPDVMATFDVRIEGAEKVKLSNGNPLSDENGVAEWHDPWPKPAYLFALVAGDLINHPDQFTTKSGRKVKLNIWVRSGDEHKCAFGMDALKRSMKWDEDVYGREYDLDLFNIVAVDDFNMGAMENKGLNIFNSAAVLASPDTSTDATYERIEAIVAHEYFHNWTGNRITCRDWFQLCLKEGLTVFRDQHFTANTRGAAVKRIVDAAGLRGRQFREDNGPLAHPVRPERFVEINNFYTSTVYEKGAEVIGMLKTLIGDEAYFKGCDLYFDRHDGQACTIEDWLKCFEDVTGRDLTQFKRWYSQAGTPRVSVEDEFEDGTYKLAFSQSTPATPDQDAKEPFLIPIAYGLINEDGEEIEATKVFELDQECETLTFKGLSQKPVASILRNFSAPVLLEQDQSDEERAFLLAHDTDPFNRWEAGRLLGRDVMLRMITEDAAPSKAFLDGLVAVALDKNLDPDFKTQVFGRPGEDYIAQVLADGGVVPDPTKIHLAAETLAQSMAEHCQDLLPKILAEMRVEGPYSPDAIDAGKRSWSNTALGLLTRLDGGKAAAAQYAEADNMTQKFSALAMLLNAKKGDAENHAFYEEWKSDRLVMDRWFGLQVATSKLADAAVKAEELTKHPDFTMENPNRFRAVFGTLGGNAAGFHDISGSAYNLAADWLIKLDAKNPQTTARMTTMFEAWRRYDADRQAMMKEAMERVLNTNDLSRDTSEMIGRILAG